ncbi:hypothetical protein JYB64_10515 [Algoriphagus aestuarii]|nr:hypothetical protein [Algoriphagus aestuarii]
MFDKICIKTKETNNEKLDIAFLIDCMLFYGNVVVIVHKQELTTLLNHFGEDFLNELIINGKLTLKIQENILGSMSPKSDLYSVDLFERTSESHSRILYETHRTRINNSQKNRSFSDHFSKIIEPFKYESNVVDEIRRNFKNEELLKSNLSAYLQYHYQGFEFPEKLELSIQEAKSDSPFDCFTIESNLDLKAINDFSEKLNGSNRNDFNFSGFILTLAESKGDIYISSKFESELVTRDLHSKFISQELEILIQKRISSQRNLDLFQEVALSECYSIGEAFIKGIITKKDLLDLLEKSDKFRSWLKGVPEEGNLVHEYLKEIAPKKKTNILPTKNMRWAFFAGIGVALGMTATPAVGAAAGLGISAFDHFILDKLTKGWKPNQFIDSELKPLTRK